MHVCFNEPACCHLRDACCTMMEPIGDNWDYFFYYFKMKEGRKEGRKGGRIS